MSNTKKLSSKEYEKLGRMLHSVAEIGVTNHRKLYQVAFLKGVVSGLGGVIGATLVVALLLWLFSILGNVPLLGPVIEIITDKVQNY